MKISRRQFMGIAGSAVGAALIPGAQTPQAAEGREASADAVGCLVDTTLCVGCRKCEQACNERHKLPKPDESFDELTVLEKPRRMDETSYTVINKYYPKHIGSLTWRRRPSFVKSQCMHCIDPSCASACIVGALNKEPSGPVIYDAGKCIGCRYCMIACPFQVPAYEYYNALDPEVRKCTFCFEYISKKGGLPACAQICPREVMTFGKRSELLELARWKMKNNPGKYVDHIYGEHEVGGTSWLYLASEPFETLGFPTLESKAPPRLTEAIQHGLFQYFATPIILYSLFGGIMWFTGFNKEKEAKEAEACAIEDTSQQGDDS